MSREKALDHVRNVVERMSLAVGMNRVETIITLEELMAMLGFMPQKMVEDVLAPYRKKIAEREAANTPSPGGDDEPE